MDKEVCVTDSTGCLGKGYSTLSLSNVGTLTYSLRGPNSVIRYCISDFGCVRRLTKVFVYPLLQPRLRHVGVVGS